MTNETEKAGILEALTGTNRFKVLPDGWIKDEALGLDWGPSSQEDMTFKQAEKYCADLGGRLPTIYELHSLVDYSKQNPAVDTEIFPDTKTDDWYWTGTETAWNKSAAWCVDFDDGFVTNDRKGDASYVRPVRPSQA